MSQEGLFPPDAVIRRVDGELVLLLGGGRALLLQLAHPMVARGVAQHSDFQGDPLARLQRTLMATYTVVFGTKEQADRATAQVGAVHERVTGVGYRANDPELLLWVHATLVDTALRVHRRFLRPLVPADAERYYQESTKVAQAFGLPRKDQPQDLAAFRSYMRKMVGELSVTLTDESRRLARRVLHPRLPLVTAPVVAGVRELTVGLLPPPLRRAYGLRWDPPRQLALDATALAIRASLPRVPPVLRRVPDRAVWLVAS
ncbi:MAG TPA: oxygenase MpaB family protein [Acidimicrobiales bacterium]|nr:oxygenase MpaB family protein [Acidimicrobiales bacterium]